MKKTSKENAAFFAGAALIFWALYLVCEIAAAFLLPREWRAPAVLCVMAGAALLSYRLRAFPAKEELAFSAAPLLPAAAAGAALNLCFSALLGLWPLPEETVAAYAEATAALTDPAPAELISTVLWVPLLEELTFRVLIHGGLTRALGPLPGLLLAALIFGLMHGQLLWMVYAALCGAVLGLIFTRRGSVWPCAAFHIAFNGANYLFPPAWTASGSGRWASLLAGAAVFAAAAFLLFRKKRAKKKKGAGS